MLSKLDEAVQNVIQEARRKAVELNHDHVGTDHIMLALLSEGEASDLFRRAGASPERLKGELEKHIMPGPSPVGGADSLPLSPIAEKAVLRAIDEARKSGAERAGIVHIMLGILEEPKGAAAKAISSCSAEPATLKQAISRAAAEGLAPSPKAMPPPTKAAPSKKGVSFISTSKPPKPGETKESPAPPPPPPAEEAAIDATFITMSAPLPEKSVRPVEVPPELAPRGVEQKREKPEAPPVERKPEPIPARGVPQPVPAERRPEIAAAEPSPQPPPVAREPARVPAEAPTRPPVSPRRGPEAIAKPAEEPQPRMFGTAGVRGLTNIEITPEMALRIAGVFGDQLGNTGTVAVGYDTRYGAFMLAQATMSGLQSAGVNVHDCGCIPTPGLASYVTEKKIEGGIMLTGSHMPIDRMGIIVILKDGAYAYADVAADLERRYEGYGLRDVTIGAEKVGQYRQATDAIELYRKRLVAMVERRLFWQSRFRVLVDPGNGTSTFVLPNVLRDLSCLVYKVNDKPSPVVNRPPEPRATNLGETAKQVVENKCILGVATDIDGDRVLFMDADGNVISEDTVGCIFIKHLARKGARMVVTPVNSSGLVEHTAKELGLGLEYCRIGQPATIQAIKAAGANFSYEESGKYYFCDQVLWPDGLLATIRLLEIMAEEKKSLAELAAEFPKFYQVKHTVECPDTFKSEVLSSVSAIWKKEAIKGKEKDVEIDGLKRVYTDNSWLLIRASGTEPLIRVYSDAPSQARAEELVSAGEAIVKKAVSQAR